MDSSPSHPKRHEQPSMQYQRLGNSGLKFSRIILGCMTYGNPNWEGSPWFLDEEASLPLLKRAFDLGINTFDTANTYSNGESETILGKALTKYSIQHSKVVIMTKLYYPALDDDPNSRPNPAVNDGPLVNQMGLRRKHIFDAVEGSLRRLNTSYIDVLQLHRLYYETPVEEIMRALHDLVQMGKVRYLGASKEREMNPFCEAEGVGLIPWSPLARGLLARPWHEKSSRGDQDEKTKRWFVGDQNAVIVSRVKELSQRKECAMSSVAMAWLMQKGACPVVGLNSVERIEAALEVLDIKLSLDEIEYLEPPYRPLSVQAI
ncbi:hypothetical protein N7488_006122 [Penicillium malachiteum]|nr:hypothetical protein N7488_006122 [Penicillium malachiteum]